MSSSTPLPHKSVVLFYKYFMPSEAPPLYKNPEHYVACIHKHQQTLCKQLHLKGRVLISGEGINGTVSAPNDAVMGKYIKAMEKFDLFGDCPKPSTFREDDSVVDQEIKETCRIYTNIDWKTSHVDDGDNLREPFPDMKISIAKEIVSTGGAVNVTDISEYGGKHLTPQQFHNALMGKTESGQEVAESKEVVLIDVRNTFEYDIGHFVNPVNGEAATNPNMVAFSAFDSTFCERNADQMRNKKVLMYCTGGIRCEKASCMLKKRGVEDVAQLQGGIHRYLDEFGDSGFFQGKNFVFDQRVALDPSSAATSSTAKIVGQCIECSAPFDEISGSRVCTVCRDLVLVCPTCQKKLHEYHCRRHSDWKYCYFTFLDRFTEIELEDQKQQLTNIREALNPPDNKNMRRTLMRQITKVSDRISKLQSGKEMVNPNDPKKCRTCMEENCDGLCWGFWKQSHSNNNSSVSSLNSKRKLNENIDTKSSTILPIQVGDEVEPASHWNILRLGEKTEKDGTLKRGRVIEIKSWGSGGDENDCVSVQWVENAQPLIYRWGVIAKSGERIYDVLKVSHLD